MPWTRVNLAPGIVKDVTRYASGGTWVDSNLVRFRDGFPERWKGWVRYLSSTILEGICRSLNRWAILSGDIYLGIGTDKRFYVATNDTIIDVTPIASTETLTNVISTTAGSTEIVIDDPMHGTFPGDYVIISGASQVGGISPTRLNGEHRITRYINDNTYGIELGGSPAASTETGGGTIQLQYLFSAGAESQNYGGGWGTSAWGEGPWGGGGGSGGGAGKKLGLWSQANWGEDLVACAYDGPIFFWDATTPTARMVDIRNLPGADGNAPSFARFIAVSHRDRHLLAFGPSNEYGDNEYAPMTIRWCSQEDLTNWNEADLQGTAGSIPLSRGSSFVSVTQTSREFLVWTDAALYSVQFVGAPDVYIAEIISDGTDIAGMNAARPFGNNVFWMGRSGFYMYDGRVTKLSCPVWNYLVNDLNVNQINKVYCATNRAQNEVIWFYPSVAGGENDKYIAYDTVQNVWTVGILSRTAWIDMDFQFAPLAAAPDGKLLYHETGNDDGSVDPPAPINAFVESAPFELSSEGAYDKGDRFMFVRKILPDVTFDNYDGINTPQMRMTLKMMDKPGGGFTSSNSRVVSENTFVLSGPEEFTEELHVRLRGRSITVRLESDTLGSLWRIGMPRFDIRTDGQR